jgi:uncharacterized membrane protein
LARIPPAQGIAAMQSINVVVLNRWFFAVFFGTAVCCLALAISSFVRWKNRAPVICSSAACFISSARS